MFSKNTNQIQKLIFNNNFGIPIVNKIQSYLWLPTHIGQSKKLYFFYLLDRIRSKHKVWKAK